MQWGCAEAVEMSYKAWTLSLQELAKMGVPAPGSAVTDAILCSSRDPRWHLCPAASAAVSSKCLRSLHGIFQGRSGLKGNALPHADGCQR